MVMNRQAEFLYKLYRVVHSFKWRALIKCNLFFARLWLCVSSVYTHISQTNSISVSLSVEIHCRTNTQRVTMMLYNILHLL